MPKIGCNRPPRTEYEVALPQSESSRAGDTISPNCSSKDDTFRVIKRAEEHFYELVPRLQFTGRDPPRREATIPSTVHDKGELRKQIGVPEDSLVSIFEQ